MPFFDAVRMALRTILTQKLKSFFSLIGVLVGVTFLIAVVSIVQGMNVYMKEQFADRLVGLNTFELRQRPDITTGDTPDDVRRGWYRRPRITYADAQFVRQRLTVPVTSSMHCSDNMTLSYRNRVAKDIDVSGAEASFFEIRNYDIAEGRAFTAQEVEAGRPVLVIGSELAEKLFAGADPLGKEITLAGLPYRVVGVVAKQGTLFGFSMDKFAVTPYTAPVKRYLCPRDVIDELQVKADNPAAMQAAMDQVEGLMRGRRRLHPSQDDNFTLQTSDAVLEGWQKLSAVLFLAMPGLVGISLVVGGIVIMNIMLMAVTERTREIGIRKALGARRRDILAQFVVEAATLSTLGAALGVLTGIGLAFFVRAVTFMPAAVAPWSIALGVILGILVGLVAGVYPAVRASRLDPIAALRAE